MSRSHHCAPEASEKITAMLSAFISVLLRSSLTIALDDTAVGSVVTLASDPPSLDTFTSPVARVGLV